MSTGRELLELAAKAAGIVLKGWTIISGNEEAVICFDAYAVETWNPLADDGDALRLAVKLNLSIMLTGRAVSVSVIGCRSSIEIFGNDSCAATRRAIVRAAAEIGRAME